MAGSWRHMTTSRGKLLNNERFCGMIENLGDAYEAAEECYGMIWWLASKAAAHPDFRKVNRTDMLGIIELARQHHEDGLKLGGVQRER